MPALKIPPPRDVEFSAIVLSTTVAVPPFRRRPPPTSASLSARVLLKIVTVPPSL